MWKLLKHVPDTLPEQRAVFMDTLIAMMDSDDRVVMLEADLGGASGSLRVKKAHPDRYIECGIMEANMIGVAAGLSMRGFVPFVHTFSPFAARRAADQIFLEGAYARNTINIFASDPGVCAATNGGTHTTFEDISLMRTIPEVSVFDPADGAQLRWLIRELANRRGVHYIRTTRKAMLSLYTDDSTFQIGRGNILRQGQDVLIIAAGQVIEDALKAAERLGSRGIEAAVIDMFTIKPLDETLILREMKGKRLVITCENHSILGGLGSAVAEVLSAQDNHPRLCRIGVADQFGQVGALEWLKQAFGLDAESIAEKVLGALGMV